ncbi:hypothetical protein [Actinophytocola sp.]|uniref:hypothetical protein n=1 Tax=Actinophytocola sp. TaxID=1872138 RepID=UPI00389AE049
MSLNVFTSAATVGDSRRLPALSLPARIDESLDGDYSALVQRENQQSHEQRFPHDFSSIPTDIDRR